MLAEIAHKGFKDDQLFFSEQQIIKSITDFLADSVDNPKYLDGKKILNSIAAQQGILVQRAEDVYSFSHLTLQEYLTAQYISQKDSRIEELVTKHLTDRRWKEIFLLVAGLKDDADELLELMEKATQKLIDTDKLHRLLVWAKYRANGSSSYFNSIGTKAIVLANALAKEAIEYFIRYTKWSKKTQIYQDVNYSQLIINLEKLQQKIPREGETKEVYQAFGNQMIDIWLKAFHLKPEMVDLSEQELKALDNYFYANLLMVECKKAAVRISRKTWSEIESRMLMPFREPT